MRAGVYTPWQMGGVLAAMRPLTTVAWCAMALGAVPSAARVERVVARIFSSTLDSDAETTGRSGQAAVPGP